MHPRYLTYLKRIAEFFLVGVVLNLIDNIIAVKAVSDVAITAKTIAIILLFTLPFAIVSELIVDGKNIFRHHHHHKDGEPHHDVRK